MVDLEAQLPQLQATGHEAEQQWYAQQQQETALKERINALQEIQNQWASPTEQQQWLERYHLQALQQLWPLLQVEKGWETALEAILREQIGAYILPEISGDALVERFADIDLQPPLRVHFWLPDRKSTRLHASHVAI